MKRGALFLTLVVAAFTAACSGGGSSTLPPPPPLGFSNSSLKGQYAFIMTGQSGFDGFLLARIGTFIADGNGGIQGGTEVVSSLSNGFQQLNFSSGTSYQVNADGRGAINLLNASGPTAFSITMTSTTTGFISETDGVNGASGTFELQDSSAFTANALTNSFVFDVSGFDPGGNFDSIVGQLVLNNGVAQRSVYDENNETVLSGPTLINTGSLSISDATNGLGTLTFTDSNSVNFQYAFVVVNSRKFHMIEIPAQGTPSGNTTIGTANAQTAPPTANTTFTGSFAFLTSGVGATTNDFKAGRFSADGSGGLNSIEMDDKPLGDPDFQVPKGTLSAMTYTVDTNFPGSGRVTISFLDSSNSKPYQFVAYMASGTQGVIQDNSPGLIADGTIMAQTGAPFSNASIAGDYAFNWSGVSNNNTLGTTGEEDFVGHVTVTSATSNNVTGAMDFSELNLLDPLKVGIHDSVLSGTGLTIAGDGTNSSGRNTLVVNATNPNGGPSSTLKFIVYPVNATTMFVINTDSDHCTGGTFTRQVTPP